MAGTDGGGFIVASGNGSSAILVLGFNNRAVARGDNTTINVFAAENSTFTAATDGCTIETTVGDLDGVNLRC